jgi:preprotein translocase subunit SecA
MSIISKVLTFFLGNKEVRDLQEISPYVERIRTETEKLIELSNDALRDRSLALRKEVRESVAEEEKMMSDLRTEAEREEDVNRKEDLYNQVDKLDKQLLEKIENKLDEVLPVAFCIV